VPIRGDLSGCRVCPVGLRRPGPQGRWLTGQESAEAVVPAGIKKPGRAEHQASGSQVRLERVTTIAAIPRRRAWWEGKR